MILQHIPARRSALFSSLTAIATISVLFLSGCQGSDTEPSQKPTLSTNSNVNIESLPVAISTPAPTTTPQVSATPDPASSHFQNGQAAYEQQNYATAIEEFTQAINTNPSADLYYARGLAYAAENQYVEAVNDFSEAIVLNPDMGNAFVKRASVRLEVQEYSRALEDTEQALEIDQDNIEAHSYKARALDLNGNLEAASYAYSEVIKRQPTNSEAYLHRGFCEFRLADYEAALRDYQFAIKLDPQSALAFTFRGTVYFAQENYVEAWLDFHHAVILDPTFAEGFKFLGDYYDQQQDFDKALEAYSKAIELNPEYSEAYRKRAMINARLGLSDQALSDRENAIKYSTNSVGIMAGDFDLEITRIWHTTSAQDKHPKNDIFLVLKIDLYNYSSKKIKMSKFDFPAFSDDKKYDVTKFMYHIREEYYQDLRLYPPNDKDGMSFEPFQHWSTFVAYDLPADLSEISIEFSPTGQKVKFKLWLNAHPDADYDYALAQINGQQVIQIQGVYFTDSIKDILSVDKISIENCKGSADAKETRSITYTTRREVRVSDSTTTNTEVGLQTPVPKVPNTYLEGKVKKQYYEEHTESTEETLAYTVSKEFAAAPGTHTNYEIIWYVVSKRGYIELLIEDQSFSIPFSIDERIEPEDRSLDQTPCP
ncbi:MAG TPA: tetratricopeptide repeat protein [Phototrophicaceae bacterium]|nr:tetratricopeptide repeat protein [Phototrophicaceae bacterium]